MKGDYRVFIDKDGVCTIREAFYFNRKSPEAVTNWTTQAEPAMAMKDEDPTHNLRCQLLDMLSALQKPMIDEEKYLEEISGKNSSPPETNTRFRLKF